MDASTKHEVFNCLKWLWRYIFSTINEDHSINMVNFAKEVVNRKYCLPLHIFHRNQLWFVFSCPWRLSSITFFTNCSVWSFSLLESQCISTSWTIFSTQAHSEKPSSFVSLYTSHTLMKISHGLHFSATKDLMTDLCSSLCTVCFSIILNSLKTNIFMRLK